MHISRSNDICRRAFLTRCAALSAIGASTSYALGLSNLGELAAQSGEDRYQALVCVFLYGGNDHANTLIPYDSHNHAKYSRIRGGIEGVALARADLARTVLNSHEAQTLTDDQILALAPTMPRLKARFDEGVMAPILNVGPLLAPLTRAQFESSNTRAHPRPANLFSHNDQQSTWQAFQPEGAQVGWGGLLGDIALSGNKNAMFTSISVSGNAVFLSGNDVGAYRVGKNGAQKIYSLGNLYGSRLAGQTLETLMRQQTGHVLENDYATVNARSIEYSSFIDDALKSAPSWTKFGEDSSLASQLSLVAQIIASRRELGVTRQIFMVSMGGFDNHSNLKEKHPKLLDILDTSLDSFYSILQRLQVTDAVTTFTASDFGRTLTYNGNGSDHGWGGHHFVLGGSVRGGLIYGKAPHISIETNDQVGRGRLLPSISVDQYAATLAHWFGVRPSDLGYVSPNIGRFESADIGFMRHAAS